MMLRAALLSVVLTGSAMAQGAGETAQRAATLLTEAAQQLDRAEGARDRVVALTAVVRAYEEGLAALRQGLRQVTIQERALSADLDAREAEIARLLGVLSTMERAPTPLLLLHPSGALGTARSSMMLSEVAPALQAEADALRGDLTALEDLRLLEEAAVRSLQEGVEGIQRARVALSTAISDRTPLPARLAEDTAQIAALLGRVDTLEAFAQGLGQLPEVPGQAILDRPLPLPVTGRVLRGFRQPDAAGVSRPGLVVATAAGALVTAPTSGTVRYAGPLLDYGNVIIQEPKPGVMFVLAGLSETYTHVGQVVVAGAPLGLMGGTQPSGQDFSRDAAAGGGTSRTETLYVEVREGGSPVNPSEWFAEE
ncbi:peptidase M23 [Jannaschia pagri]|uniref:Peptidase M23 n=1 Tax=Jannaschia pagri TaxID=2829797 RepID=A0ABQ4NPS2_9RHOB|nr:MULTISPECIES: peptidoglycan DD-metalloendopeptidase family protein [unclassified Jannaschia]GIT92728.1 peptidase M23 [Jannaschia sp. AI_61]GIT96412.1 peptidase M23 [Jannaschia sp. AI_62]